MTHHDTITIPLGWGKPLVDATFLARPNRFLVEAELHGAIVQAHLADRGRLLDTLYPGVRLLLACHDGAKRKTAFQAVAAYREIGEKERGSGFEHHASAAALVSLDTHLPNRLIELALRAGALPQFAGYPSIRREVTVGGSRFDFQLADHERRCTIEVKSAGVVDDLGLFPDAPTERGRRHLHELAELAQVGERVALVFVVQGSPVRAMAIDTTIDPAFAEALRHAASAGVEVYAYACPLTRAGLALGAPVPVLGLC